ncbi:MAG: nitroreductase family protein [Bacteroidales bacterium]|nr:nitroreductase family protein [Bacteroidales bacterium]
MKRTFIAIAFVAAVLTSSGCGNKAQTSSEMENPVVENIMARRSVRYYTDQAVPREVLQKIAECGVNAPNAMNSQNWEVRIIDDPEWFNGATEAMGDNMMHGGDASDPKFRNAFRNATAAIAVACPDDPSGMAFVNIGLLGENVCLAALSYGLGSVVMAGPVMSLNNTPAAKPFLDRLKLSEGYKLRLIIGLGYPDEAPAARPRDLSKIKFVD